MGYVTFRSMTGGYQGQQQQTQFYGNAFFRPGKLSDNPNYQSKYYLDGFWAFYCLLSVIFIVIIRKVMRFCLQNGAETIASSSINPATAGNLTSFWGSWEVYKLAHSHRKSDLTQTSQRKQLKNVCDAMNALSLSLSLLI